MTKRCRICTLLFAAACTGLATMDHMAAQQPVSAARPPATDTGRKPADLEWPLAAADRKYATIDGHQIHKYVEELAAIGRRDRDAGNRYWGRLAGFPADARTREWLMEKFRRAGLQDVREELFDLPPQWFGTSWDVSIASGEKSVELKTARPYAGSPATPDSGIDLEPVWVGLGSAADFAGRDIKGKAVFIYSIPYPGALNHTATHAGVANPVLRAQELGAAAIAVTVAVPGRVSAQMSLYFPGPGKPVTVPIVSLSMEDGLAARDIIEAGGARVKLRVEAKMVPGLKSGTVWGTLPGNTDEDILLGAELAGHFDGAGDNASGVAALVALAEYYSKMPRAERRRTIRFAGTSGHHHGSGATYPQSSKVMHEQRESLFANTALIINLEHIAWRQMYVYGPALRMSNGVDARRWIVKGSDRLRGILLDACQAFGVTLLREPDVRATGDLAAIQDDAPYLHMISSPYYYHSDHDTPEVIPPSGLAASTRVFARVIDAVNRLNRADLLAPPPSSAAAR